MEADKISFGKKALSVLRKMGFTIVAFYPYDSRSDILGYLPAQAPLKIPIRTLVTIINGDTTSEKIASFSKIAKVNNVTKTIIFSPNKEPTLDTDVKDLVRKLGADLIDAANIESIIPKIEPSAKDLSELDNLAPKPLIYALPDLALQQIPSQISKVLGVEVDAWKIFENAVFSAFQHGFSYETKKLGSETLFEREPEGVVITSGIRFGLVYECKSADGAYRMTHEHELKYSEYIRNKKLELSETRNIELKYFVLVGPDFAGDLELRRENMSTNWCQYFSLCHSFQA